MNKGSTVNNYDPNFFAELVKIEPTNFWFVSRNRLIAWALKRYFPQANSFFEIGCGTGCALSNIKLEFPHMSLYGSDVFVEGLRYAENRLGKSAELFHLDARNMSFEDKFDVIGAFDLIEHIDEDELVLFKAHKALRKGGGILLSVPQHNFLWSRTDEEALHLRRYANRALKDKVEHAGFRVLDTISFVSLLLPFLFISRRLWKRKHNKKYRIMQELELNSLMNAAFLKISGFEQRLTEFGIRLPFGGSLLLVGQKA